MGAARSAVRLRPSTLRPADKLHSRGGVSSRFPKPQKARLVRIDQAAAAPAGTCGGQKGLPRQAPHFPQAAAMPHSEKPARSHARAPEVVTRAWWQAGWHCCSSSLCAKHSRSRRGSRHRLACPWSWSRHDGATLAHHRARSCPDAMSMPQLAGARRLRAGGRCQRMAVLAPFDDCEQA